MGEPETILQTTPEEFDRLCEKCGYSLRGLVENRCPECGKEFDPNKVPLARIAWLHRDEVGFAKAYLQTVFGVLFRPANFAREFRRPVHIPLEMGASFRTLNIRIATLSIVLLPATALVFAMLVSLIPASLPGFIGFFAVCCGCALFVYLFLQFVTRLPAWVQLKLEFYGFSAILDYASASLAIVPVIVFLCIIAAPIFPIFSTPISFRGIYLLAIGVPVIFSWLTNVVLILHAARFDRWQTFWFTFYLLIHWAISFVGALVVFFGMCVLLLIIAMIVSSVVQTRP